MSDLDHGLTNAKFQALVDAFSAVVISPPPPIWGERMPDYFRIRFLGSPSLELRVVGDTWALWFAGTFIADYRDPSAALAEARRNGWLGYRAPSTMQNGNGGSSKPRYARLVDEECRDSDHCAARAECVAG